MCGHYTLEFVRRWLFGISQDAETETARQLGELIKLSDPSGGIVYMGQIVSVLARNNPSLTADLWDSGKAKRELPLRKSTLDSGWRQQIDWLDRDIQFARRNGATGHIQPPTNINTFLTETDEDATITVHVGKLPTSDLAQSLSFAPTVQSVVIVLLVDSRYLPYVSPEKKRSTNYSGHFITLYAYDPNDQTFLVFDSLMPESQPPLRITLNQLNRCRRLSSMACQCRNSVTIFRLQPNLHKQSPKRKRLSWNPPDTDTNKKKQKPNP